MSSDNKIIFDLALLELALRKAIEILNAESDLLSEKINVKIDQLDKLAKDKEDIMQFIEWHIPIIVRYVKIHQNDMDDIQDIFDLATRAQAMNKAAQEEIQKKVKFQPGRRSFEKASTITVMSGAAKAEPVLEAVFVNDSEEMPKKISTLLKAMLKALENGFNKMLARKKLNDQIFDVMSAAMKSVNSISYSPKKKKQNLQNNLIYNEDC